MPVQLPVTHSPQSGNGDSVQSFPAVLHLRREVAPAVGRPDAMPRIGEKGLPEPEFPQRPELLTNDPWPGDGVRHWTPGQIYHAMRGWAFPYVKSRILPGDFHPIVAYLFTEYKCNLDCHYCYSFDNRVKGMTEETARASIDWLHSTTCRVLALMGGEPLLRPKFVHKIVSYAAKKASGSTFPRMAAC